MSPEYGATCGFFPVDELTLEYLRLTGRSAEPDRPRRGLLQGEHALARPERGADLLRRSLELDLSTVVPSLAGPRRPQDRVPLSHAKTAFLDSLGTFGVENALDQRQRRQSACRHVPASDPTTEQAPGGAAEPEPDATPVAVAGPGRSRVHVAGTDYELEHGNVVIAAITSCTNTSNPQVMVGAGLLAKKAVERGLTSKPWVKTSLAPGSKVVTEYYDKAGLTQYLEQLGFNTVGYGCTTCIGNSGPLPEAISVAVEKGDLVVCSVLSGNRNFEGRINPDVKANYLASPPLVVAYALAGPDGHRPARRSRSAEDQDGNDVYLRDIWPSAAEIQEAITASVRGEMFQSTYADVFTGDERLAQAPRPRGRALRVGARLDLRPAGRRTSTGCRRAAADPATIAGARCLVLLGDSVTTDHISPAGSIRPDEPGRPVSDRARRRAEGLQLLRLPPRQPRGDGPRHLRERPPAGTCSSPAPRAAAPSTCPTARR